MKTSENIIEIAKALSAMQAVMDNASKKVEAFKYKYSDLSSVWEVLRGPMTDNGLCVVQDPVSSDDGVSVVTRVMHESGQWIEFGPLLIPVGKRDAHSTGSAITYAKRYALCAALGIVTEDDDGQAAQKNPPKEMAKDTGVISDAQYLELENFLEDNLELRQNLLNYLKIDSIQKMPVKFYASALKSAKAANEEKLNQIAMGA